MDFFLFIRQSSFKEVNFFFKDELLNNLKTTSICEVFTTWPSESVEGGEGEGVRDDFTSVPTYIPDLRRSA